VVVKTETDKSCEVKNSEIHAERPIDSFLSDGWSDLRYVDVNIDGICGTVRGLDDSGAQLCLVRADVVQNRKCGFTRFRRQLVRGRCC